MADIKMDNLGKKIRDKWIKDDPTLKNKFDTDKDAMRVINATAMIVSDYKHRKNS